jgi:hypothetical protein
MRSNRTDYPEKTMADAVHLSPPRGQLRRLFLEVEGLASKIENVNLIGARLTVGFAVLSGPTK